jgi:hypothetical protein
MQTPAKRGLDECYEVHKSNKRVSGVLWVQFPSYWSVLSSKGLGKKQPFSHFLMLKMITFKDRLTNMWENSKHCRFIAGMGAAPVTRSPLHTAAGALVHTLRAVLTFAARSTVMHGFLHAPNLDHLPGARRHRRRLDHHPRKHTKCASPASDLATCTVDHRIHSQPSLIGSSIGRYSDETHRASVQC